jgi:large subunit ribosomal protein L45
LKVIKVDLPDFQEAQSADQYSPEEIRAKMKERGMLPPRPWMERPYEISSTADIFEPYVTPEGDGKASYISKEGAKQTAEIVSKKSKTWMAFRKIRRYDEEFDGEPFALEAEKIYLGVHKAVAEKDKFALRNLVTEKAYPEITHNMQLRTVHWKFLHSIEPPKVVYARCTDVVTKENIFAQVTCRFFTKQILAIYDRFGRLAHGSEVIAKDVLEYVVFEKHIANQYGSWRIHGKIIPDWAPTNFETSYRTTRMDPEPEVTTPPPPPPEAKEGAQAQEAQR